jgi:hypothetical protein
MRNTLPSSKEGEAVLLSASALRTYNYSIKGTEDWCLEAYILFP